MFNIKRKLPINVNSNLAFDENQVLSTDECLRKRGYEKSYLKESQTEFGYPYSIIENRGLHQPFTLLGWTFLLVCNKNFPYRTNQGELPIKIFIVNPNLVEISKIFNLDMESFPCVKVDSEGLTYLDFENAQELYEEFLKDNQSVSLSEKYLQLTREWLVDLQNQLKQVIEKSMGRFVDLHHCHELTSSLFGTVNSVPQATKKYVDGRASKSQDVNLRCQKVVLSNRAFVQIVKEAQDKITTETGGLLLGHYEDGVWYVVEACDSGINAVFAVTYHEGDAEYQNHVCQVISRSYENPLVFLGMWHRHPGSFDKFSATDDGTNSKYVTSVGTGCISALVNFDPDFRLTFYYVEHDARFGVRYTKVDVEVGDDKFPDDRMMKLADMDTIISRMDMEASYEKSK